MGNKYKRAITSNNQEAYRVLPEEQDKDNEIMGNVSKRKLRLDRLWKNDELIGKTTDKPCRSCGCTRYLIFLTSDKKSQGVYCADCGLWQKFESAKKKICLVWFVCVKIATKQ